MLNNSIVRARINEQIKEEAAAVLSEVALHYQMRFGCY
jgi:antitoxin component of RelBE/YafQ-DinJ toxin-antitoxin module